MGSETRKRNIIIMVRVDEAEKETIDQLARQTHLTVPELIRRLVLGHEIKSTLHYSAYEALLNLRAELGRIGGLLKLWVSRTDTESKEITRELNIRTTLNELERAKTKINSALDKL